MCWCSFWKSLCCCSRYQLTPEDKNKKSGGQRCLSEPDLSHLRKFQVPPYFQPLKHSSASGLDTPNRKPLIDSGTLIDRLGRDQGEEPPSESFREVGPVIQYYGSIQNEEPFTEEDFKKAGRRLAFSKSSPSSSHSRQGDKHR